MEYTKGFYETTGIHSLKPVAASPEMFNVVFFLGGGEGGL